MGPGTTPSRFTRTSRSLQRDRNHMNSTPESVELVQRLFIQHIDQIRGYVRIILPPPADIDDVVQDVFVAMTARAADYAPSQNFKSWAYGFVRNKVKHAAAPPKSRGKLLGDGVLEVLTASLPDLDTSADELRYLEECIDELSPKARAIMHHRYQHGLQPQEVAELIGWTANSVRVALCRARAALRKCVEHKLLVAGAR